VLSDYSLRAAYILEAPAFQLIYGKPERLELGKLLSFNLPPLTKETWGEYRSELVDIHVVYSGWGSPVLDGTFLDALPSLKIVFHGAGTVKPYVTEEFWERGIRITSAARANAIPVAEFTLSQVIFSLKHGWQAAAATRKARRFVRNDDIVPSVYDSTVGLISLGHTGRLVAKRLKELDINILAFDPYISPSDAAALGVKTCSLLELFAQSDVVSCHTPLLPETKHLLGAEHFSAMKPGATFINTARGSVVDQPAMISVLSRRPDIFAVLDVTDPEPPGEDSPLFTLPNVVVTPHIAGSIGPECRRMGKMMVEETVRYLAGAPLLGELHKQQLPLLA
jgi:phosphoglycerate dehydrogenase-like enzyme